MRLQDHQGMRALVAFFVLCGSALAQHDPLRPAVPFEQEPKTAPLVNAENNDRKRVRSYAMQPPTIPHKTDNYQVDKNANKCMTCHARTRAGETQATPISITHYQDRDGNFLADVSPRRYFCDQCHVVQMQTEPTVKNRFQDVDTLIKKPTKK
jgi:cytochrome c-type protein NapB